MIKNRKNKKFGLILVFVTITTIIASMYSVSASAYTFDPASSGVKITSEAVYMENLDTENVIVSKNAEKQYVPASLTKIMTAVLVLDKFKDNIDSLKTTKVKVKGSWLKELEGTYCSTAGLSSGETVNYYDLLCGLLIPSGCDAANIIAYDMAGSVESFTEMMNAKAKSLGMTKTVYYDAHGLDLGDNENITTASDQAKLCKYAMNNYPIFLEITSQYGYYLDNGNYIVNTNKLLDENDTTYYYGYVLGIKTGNLDTAGRCLASVAEKGGYSYLIVTLKAPQENKNGDDVFYNCLDHKRLYMWAYKNLSYNVFVKENEEITEAKVLYGDGTDYVNVKAANEVSKIWLSSVNPAKVKRKITLKENIIAPVYQGDTLGTLELVYEGQTIETVKLVATSDVKKATLKAETAIAKSFFKSKQFLICILLVALSIIIYCIIFKVVSKKRSNKITHQVDDDYYDNK